MPAATRPDPDADSEALIDIGVECCETPQPCRIPLNLGVVSIRSACMGESVANVGDAPEAVWVGREGHGCTFADGAMASVSLDLHDRRNLEPKAIRARLCYGDRNDDALPGQATRFGILTKIALAVGLLFALFLWWMRRPASRRAACRLVHRAAIMAPRRSTASATARPAAPAAVPAARCG